MNWVISDIHGCYDEFLELLNKIDFSNNDTLYLLGDMVDRGPKPVKVVQDVMERSNVVPFLGNHDYMALSTLYKLNMELAGDKSARMSVDERLGYWYWRQDGGAITSKQFLTLPEEERNRFLEYLQRCAIYKKVTVQKRQYILGHAGIPEIDKDKHLDECDTAEFLFHRMDYEKRYFQDENLYLVSGHTPTILIRKDQKPLVYEKHGHIAIDCGCVFGLKLAAYCLDTEEKVYVDSHQMPHRS